MHDGILNCCKLRVYLFKQRVDKFVAVKDL